MSGRNLDRQARFADPAGSEQREEPTGWVGQQSGDRVQLLVATDERGRLGRQAAGQLLVAACGLIGITWECARECWRAITGPLDRA